MSGSRSLRKVNRFRAEDAIGIQDILLEYILSSRWKDYKQFSRTLTRKILSSHPKTSQELLHLIQSIRHPFFTFNEVPQKDFIQEFPSEDILRRLVTLYPSRRLKETDRRERRKTISKRLRVLILQRDGFRCKMCGKTSRETTLEVDHIIPLSRGGTDSLDNLQTLCVDCNKGKSDLRI